MEEGRKLTRYELEEFLMSRVWRFIVATANERAFQKSEENNTLDPMTQAAQICRNQGAIAIVQELIDVPSVVLEELEYENKIKREEIEEDGRE